MPPTQTHFEEQPFPMLPLNDLAAQQRAIRPGLDAAIQRVLDHGKYIMGPEVGELERQLAEFVGSKNCIACASGTDALLMGLMALGVGPGDAVFTTPFTFIATVEPVTLLGATPVFVDIDPETYNLGPALLEPAFRRVCEETHLRPRGIVPVDLFGLPADYHSIREFADAHDLFVLQDGAQSFGAEYNGRRAPTHGDIGAASFFPAKPLGCYGDGGAVFTDHDQLAELVRSIRVHGRGTDKYDNIRVGLNARLDTLQAAILLQKLKVYPEELERRQQVAAYYRQTLGGDYKLQRVPASSRSVWAQYVLETDGRGECMQTLREAGISTNIYYKTPLHLLPAFSELGHVTGDFPVAESVSHRIMALPMHPYLTLEQQRHICDTLASSKLEEA